MPAKHLIVSRKIDKSTLKLPKKIQKRITDIYNIIQQNPLLGEKFHGELANYYKLRVGDYRIIYRFDAKKSLVKVVKIEHRQGVYR